MTEAYLPPIPDPVITATAKSRIATDPEGRGRRRASGRGLSAFVVVKAGDRPDGAEAGGIDAVTGCGPVMPLGPEDLAPAQDATAVVPAAPVPSPEPELPAVAERLAVVDRPAGADRPMAVEPAAAAEHPAVAATQPAPIAVAPHLTAVALLPVAPGAPAAIAAPAADPMQIGQAVAEAVANAVAAQTELAERYLAAARRIDELEARLRDLGREREAAEEAYGARIRTLEAEREAAMIELVARIHGLEAERDHMAEELRAERDRRLVEAAELLADVLTPRLCGVLDEHTGMADRYAAAAQRVGELEAQVARLTSQVNGAHAWRAEFDELERAAATRPWWKFWG